MEIALLVGVILFTAALLAWPVWFKLETRARRRRNPGYNPPNVMGILDELYQPSVHQASQIQEVQRVLPRAGANTQRQRPRPRPRHHRPVRPTGLA